MGIENIARRVAGAVFLATPDDDSVIREERVIYCPPDELGVLRGHFSSEVGGNMYSKATGKWYR